YLVIERLVGRSSRTAEQQPEIRAERELEALEAALADGRNVDRRMAFEGRQRVLRVRPAEGESERNRSLPPRTRLPGRSDAYEVGLDRAREPRKERELLVLLDDLAPFREHLGRRTLEQRIDHGGAHDKDPPGGCQKRGSPGVQPGSGVGRSRVRLGFRA